MDTSSKIQIMQAFVEGKTIETKDKSIAGALYITMGNKKEPLWNWESFDYRIKPEPMEIQVWVGGELENLERVMDRSCISINGKTMEQMGYTLKTFVEKGDA